jgi:hypothetical protein
MFNLIGFVVSSDKEKKVYRGCYLLSYHTNTVNKYNKKVNNKVIIQMIKINDKVNPILEKIKRPQTI